MTTRRNFLRLGGLAVAGLVLDPKVFAGSFTPATQPISQLLNKRPAVALRKFRSEAVEAEIKRIKPLIPDTRLAQMFENCFPNTLDTTVSFEMKDGKPDTFVITGDIDAMWLRDSSAQVFPYLPFTVEDVALRTMIEGVIRRQSRCICLDPYANAFNKDATGSKWDSDHTRMLPELHERKWEIDSLCYPVRLAYHYWKHTGATDAFDANWKQAMQLIYATFLEQQRKGGTMDTPYTFTRKTEKQSDTVLNEGYGSPVRPTGMICSSFRPSDDATIFSFLIPSNLFAVESLRQMAELSEKVSGDMDFGTKCRVLADEVYDGVLKYGIIKHPKYGRMYAYEVDGFGGQLLMDDANVPNLMSLPYLCSFIKTTDGVYRNTRRFVLSNDNPYYFSGKAGSGIGGPHVGLGWIWPMSIIMRGLTTTDTKEIDACLSQLAHTDADTGFIHEAFYKDDALRFTRSWFAWANTLFGELILHRYGIRQGNAG